MNIKPLKTSINNYKAIIANTEGISICSSSSPKTQTRFTSENLLMSAMDFCCVVACTHYDVTTEIRRDIRKEIRDNDTPKGVSLLYDMILKAHNNLLIAPVIPALVLSTDDKVNYICEGEGKREGSFWLVGSRSLLKAGTRSK